MAVLSSKCSYNLAGLLSGGLLIAFRRYLSNVLDSASVQSIIPAGCDVPLREMLQPLLLKENDAAALED